MGFLTGHQRLSIPAILGHVITFNRGEDLATRVPDMIGFQNDSDMEVTLHFDAGQNKAQAVSTVDGSSGYTIDSTHKVLKVAIDGEAPVEVTLTTGSPRSRAQVIADINTALGNAGGNTAKARAVGSGSQNIAIVSGTTGTFSSVAVSAASSNDVAATLGFGVGSSTNEGSYVEDIVDAVTIKAKGMHSFVNPRKSAGLLRIRGEVGEGDTGVSVMIDATPLYAYSGVQQ